LRYKYRIGFVSALLLLFTWAAWQARDFAELAQFFPLYISVGAVILLIIQLVMEIRASIAAPSAGGEDDGLEAQMLERIPAALKYLGWFFGYILLIYFIGLMAATALFLLGFLLMEARMRLLPALVGVVITVLAINLFGDVMKLYWPRALFDLWFW